MVTVSINPSMGAKAGDTQQISRIRIDPKNPDNVYVAALGHLWGPNEERGVFRSHDGGKTWQKILFRDQNTGASDLIFEPGNPNTLYAATWQVRRQPWRFDSGGPTLHRLARAHPYDALVPGPDLHLRHRPPRIGGTAVITEIQP